MKQNDDFSFLEEMSCVIADLDKSRLQIPKDEYKKLIKYWFFFSEIFIFVNIKKRSINNILNSNL